MARPPRATQYEERGWALRASGRSSSSAVVARAGQRRADPDDFAVDVEARRRAAEADLASPCLLARQVADESSRHDRLHPARGFLAEGRAALGRVDALEADRGAGDDAVSPSTTVAGPETCSGAA